MSRYLIIFAAILAVVAAPMILRPAASARTADYAAKDRLVIITPHIETIRHELERGFASWMQETHGRKVIIDWRVPGGTSEITKVIRSEYTAALEAAWPTTGKGPWKREWADTWADPKSTSMARLIWKESHVSCGMDLLLGGGPIDYNGYKKLGCLLAVNPTGQYGPAAIRKAHPEWFTDAIIPATVSGQPYYDPELCWVGSCLSAFGLCYHIPNHQRRGLPLPQQWDDLARPTYLNQIALSDPTKSGTIAAMFELIAQTHIARAMYTMTDGATEPAALQNASELALRTGWEDGWRTIRRVGANARYWTDSSNKIPLDVSEGEALAGMCVDFYARNFIERLTLANGTSRLGFIAPVGATIISPQPMALLRGAPNPSLAHHFMEWMLSPAGQHIWGHRVGTPGGPQKQALRNMPIRRDYYTPEVLAHAADPDLRPLEAAASFTYRPAWTADLFSAIRILTRASCIDTHAELKTAWQALITHHSPPAATALFDDMTAISLANVRQRIVPVLESRHTVKIAQLTRELASEFRATYREVTRLAEAGQ